ncbi:protein of unknown function [Pedobacter sp. ok626]|uniref:DUF4302 domain-containing protein n=1 Tax=Pedobacter sp. ok626 TaxID=1761882 RepID=UPI000891BDFC|nr:DUF4302 domain-containing protein [Pedobacter sp. ok626]SDL83919.1 protein of unknown function [Pedobacter sp. ok626]
MKKFIYIALVITGFIAGCKKDNNPIFEDPDVRLSAVLAEDQAKLLSAADGWKATIYPLGGKGFTYYFKFTADGKVSMLSDFNLTSAGTLAASTYRLKALQRPTLIFDSYNYIHLAADPDVNISGGGASTATGLKSDFEFAFTEAVGDTVKFEGTFNKNAMSMVKLSATESQAILAGGLKTMMEANALYLIANRYPYIQFADGTKGAVDLNPVAKSFKFTYVDAQNAIVNQSAVFSFGINKVVLSTPMKYGSVSFNELLWDSANKAYYIMAGATRITLQNGTTPLVPLSLLFGYANTFAYRKITIPATGLPVGVTSGFTAVYNSTVSLFAGTGRTITLMTLTLTSNNTLSVDVNYRNATTAFVASASYTYTRVGDVFTLSAPVYNGNWVSRTAEVLPLANYMLSGPFKVNWVTSSNPTNTSTMGGFYRTADLSSFFYGVL